MVQFFMSPLVRTEEKCSERLFTFCNQRGSAASAGQMPWLPGAGCDNIEM